MDNQASIPDTNESAVVRTDFDNQEAWNAICELVRRPVHEAGEVFYAYVEFVDDVRFRDLSSESLLARVAKGYKHTFLFVVDKATTQSPEFPIVVMDLYDERGRSFRAIPSQIQGIQNNLSIANMDFRDFADNIDEDGIFRGFKEP